MSLSDVVTNGERTEAGVGAQFIAPVGAHAQSGGRDESRPYNQSFVQRSGVVKAAVYEN